MRGAWALALLLAGCVTAEQAMTSDVLGTSVAQSVNGTVGARLTEVATWSAPRAATCVPAVTPPATPTPRATAGPGGATPTRTAPLLTPLPIPTVDYWGSEVPYCGQWGQSMTLQDWQAGPQPGGVNIRKGPGTEFAVVDRMRDLELFLILRQYTANASNVWVCVYAIRDGKEVYGWSAQVYQGQKLLTVYP